MKVQGPDLANFMLIIFLGLKAFWKSCKVPLLSSAFLYFKNLPFLVLSSSNRFNRYQNFLVSLHQDTRRFWILERLLFHPFFYQVCQYISIHNATEKIQPFPPSTLFTVFFHDL